MKLGRLHSLNCSTTSLNTTGRLRDGEVKGVFGRSEALMSVSDEKGVSAV